MTLQQKARTRWHRGYALVETPLGWEVRPSDSGSALPGLANDYASAKARAEEDRLDSDIEEMAK